MSEKTPIHKNHRERMRERCLRCGIDTLADHEYLEMLLYYSTPRGDTNPISHGLMERFSDLNGIFEADFDELIAQNGIGEQSAFLIQLIADGVRRYAKGILEEKPSYFRLDYIARYLWSYFVGVNHEQLYALFFNGKMNMLDCVRLAEGSVNAAAVPVRRLAEIALQKRATTVVLAHNHPNGLTTPSPQDFEITTAVTDALGMIDVCLLEHLIVANSTFYPIIRHHTFTEEVMASNDAVRNAQIDLKEFYNVDYEQFRFPDISLGLERNK